MIDIINFVAHSDIFIRNLAEEFSYKTKIRVYKRHCGKHSIAILKLPS